MLNLASSAGLPAGFPLDAADFANIPGTDRLCTLNVKQNLQCGSSAQENPPGDLSKLQIFHGISFKMLWLKIKRERDGEGSWVVPEQYDGSAPISILIVHKFQVKVSVCTAR